MSKMFYFCSFGVCFLVFCFLEGCSSDVIMKRGAEKAKFEQDYKPIILKVQELENVRDEQVWRKEDFSMDISLVRKSSFYDEFYNLSSVEDVFAIYSVVAGLSHALEIVFYYKDKLGVYHTYKEVRSIGGRIGKNSRFLELEYVGSGKFAIKHEYKPVFSWSLLFLRFWKLVLEAVSSILFAILFFQVGLFKVENFSSRSSS